VNGVQGRSIEFKGQSPVQKNGKPDSEHDWLVTLPQGQGGLVYLVFITPESAFNQIKPTYDKMLQSLKVQ